MEFVSVILTLIKLNLYHFPFKNEKLLVISPHPDDEILGCCGFINKIKKEGGEVYVQILTLGGYKTIGSNLTKKEKWKNEFIQVSKSLKIDGYDIMLYRDKIKHLDELPKSQIIEYLETKSKISLFKLRPTIVLIPTIFSSHQDHTEAYKIAISVLRMHSLENFVAPKLVMSYESPEYYFWSPYLEFGKFSPNFFIELTEKDVSDKISTLSLYKSQIKEGKRDGGKIRSLAAMRGSEAGVPLAEAFHVHRFLWNCQ